MTISVFHPDVRVAIETMLSWRQELSPAQLADAEQGAAAMKSRLRRDGVDLEDPVQLRAFLSADVMQSFCWNESGPARRPEWARYRGAIACLLADLEIVKAGR